VREAGDLQKTRELQRKRQKEKSRKREIQVYMKQIPEEKSYREERRAEKFLPNVRE